jgi:Flp pilus assembly protein TadD
MDNLRVHNTAASAQRKACEERRKRLGESLATIQKFDTPLEQATTSSLEALQAYTLGRKAIENADQHAAIAFFQRAVSLDPNFPIAYNGLGVAYWNTGQTALGAQNTAKAYALSAGGIEAMSTRKSACARSERRTR